MYFSILIISIFSVCICAAPKVVQSKFTRLENMKANHMIDLNDNLYTEFILNGQRDFDAIILYTTIGNAYGCRLCPATNREFATMAAAYDTMKEKADRNVLFLRVSLDTSPNVFKYHSFNTAPIISYLAASDVVSRTLNPNNDYNLDYPVRAENIASFVRSKIHVMIDIYRFPWIQVIIACSIVFGLPLVAYIYLFNNGGFYKLLESYKIYLVISLVIYGVAVTGIVYDIIHSPPMMDCNQNGCSIFMSNGQNNQTVLEGVITGGLCVMCASMMILLYEKSNKDDSNVDGKVNKYLALFGVGFVGYFLSFCVRTPWYPSVFSYRG